MRFPDVFFGRQSEDEVEVSVEGSGKSVEDSGKCQWAVQLWDRWWVWCLVPLSQVLVAKRLYNARTWIQARTVYQDILQARLLFFKHASSMYFTQVSVLHTSWDPLHNQCESKKTTVKSMILVGMGRRLGHWTATAPASCKWYFMYILFYRLMQDLSTTCRFIDPTWVRKTRLVD